MKILADLHTHTIASDHAYSTVLENAKWASEAGLSILAITDHAPALGDAPHRFHFENYRALDTNLYGVQMMYGVELNILDTKGNVDFDEALLKRMDICIASIHIVVLATGSEKENTQAFLNAMQNPYVHIIGHPEDGRVPVDYEAFVLEAVRTNTLIELNNSSLSNVGYRTNARENALKTLKLCEKYGAMISIGTDAHFATAVGKADHALGLLEEIAFPEELVLNTSLQGVQSIKERKKA